MFRVLEILCVDANGRGDTIICPDNFKTVKEAAKFIEKELEAMQAQLNDPKEIKNGEKKWYWKRHKYDFDYGMPYWTDGSMMYITIKWPDIKPKKKGKNK